MISLPLYRGSDCRERRRCREARVAWVEVDSGARV
jgi:hypothetical protein